VGRKGKGQVRKKCTGCVKLTRCQVAVLCGRL
jgi:hypothetical protein